MRDPLPSYPGYALRRAANATAAELAGRLATLFLRQSDVSVLILVGENPGVTASALRYWIVEPTMSCWTKSLRQAFHCPGLLNTFNKSSNGHGRQRMNRAGVPNPSIERTCPGKPGHAAHVER
jgi:hypothetical protein